MGEFAIAAGELSSTICSANGSPPSAEGGKGWRRSRHKALFRAFQARPKDGARLAALRSPFGNLRPLLIGLYRTQRRKVAAALSAAVTITKQQGTALTFQAEPTMQKHPPKRQPLFGRRGLGRRGFSQRSRLLPRVLLLTSLEEGARGRGLFYRKGLSLAYFPFIPLLTFVRNRTILVKSDFGLGGMKWM